MHFCFKFQVSAEKSTFVSTFSACSWNLLRFLCSYFVVPRLPRLTTKTAASRHAAVLRGRNLTTPCALCTYSYRYHQFVHELRNHAIEKLISDGCTKRQTQRLLLKQYRFLLAIASRWRQSVLTNYSVLLLSKLWLKQLASNGRVVGQEVACLSSSLRCDV